MMLHCLAGCDTWYVQPHYDVTLGIPHGVSPDALQLAISSAQEAGKRVKAALVVSPTYFGACSDITGDPAFQRDFLDGLSLFEGPCKA